MRILNISLTLGGISGFLAIAFGAYAEHVLRPSLSPQDYENLTTALRYQLLHAALLAGAGSMRFVAVPPAFLRRLQWVAGFFAAGTLLFCGGIYFGTLVAPMAMHLAPIGGFCFMLGWLALASAAFIRGNVRKPDPRAINLTMLRRRR